MMVLHEGRLTEVSDLPDGKYLPKSSRFLHPTAPIVDRDRLVQRIADLGYMNDKVKVEGPFNFLYLTPKGDN